MFILRANLLILVSPWTNSEICFPNVSVISFIDMAVSSTVSCNNPAAIADASRLIEVKILATSIGCVIYGSPDCLV